MLFFEEFYGSMGVKNKRVGSADLPEPELQMPAKAMDPKKSLEFG